MNHLINDKAVYRTAPATQGLLINSVREPFPPTALRRRHAQTARYSTSSYKIDYFIVIKNFLNPKEHENPISGTKVTAILLKGLIRLLVELHWEGSASAACAADLFHIQFGKFNFRTKL